MPKFLILVSKMSINQNFDIFTLEHCTLLPTCSNLRGLWVSSSNKCQKNVMVSKLGLSSGALDPSSSITVKSVPKRLSTESCHCLSNNLAEMWCSLTLLQKEDRVSLLKPICQIEGMDDESEDIFQTSLIDRYAERPDSLSDICLAEFAANYITQSSQELQDGGR